MKKNILAMRKSFHNYYFKRINFFHTIICVHYGTFYVLYYNTINLHIKNVNNNNNVTNDIEFFFLGGEGRRGWTYRK